MIEFVFSKDSSSEEEEEKKVVQWKELRQQILLQQEEEEYVDELGIERMIIKGFSSSINNNNNNSVMKKKSVVSNPNPTSTSTSYSNNINRVTLNVSNVLLSAVCSGIMTFILSSKVITTNSHYFIDADSLCVILSVLAGFMVLLVELYFILKYIN